MISLTSLWLPILLSAVFVFLASSIIHMVLKYHWSDYSKLPNEDRVLEALSKENLPPGNYGFPMPKDMKDMASPEMQAKYEKGPVAFMSVLPNAAPAMGKNLVLWFLFCLLMSFFVAYLASRTLGAGADYLAVFRLVGTAAFLGYGVGHIVDSIWKAQNWSTTCKFVFDGLIYALVTAGTFGWLWPN